VAEFREMVLEKTYFSANDWFTKISGDAKQGMIYSNESQEILRKLSLKTYESDYKIMIIWLPEKMHETAANRLLKILEEPPEKTIFLMVSNAPDTIITTILSRTQHINIPRIDTEDIVEALMSNNEIDITHQDALKIARISNGSYLNALALLNNDDENRINFERFVMIMRLAWQVGNKKDHASLKTLKKWSEEMAASSIGREKQKEFLIYAQRMTRENFIFNLQNPDLNYLSSYESDFSKKFSPFINERNVEDIMKEFDLAENHITRNVNAKMVFFDLTLKIIMLLKR
jgi:DNA polymerase-3 subunit delta'